MKKSIIILAIFFVVTIALPAVSSAQEPVACEFEYTVQAGDWLSRIAEKYYGEVLAYPAIVTASNADSGDDYTDIVDPDLIEPGWTLCIPSGEDMAGLLGTGVTSAPSAPEGLARTDLANATYNVEYTPGGTATLTDGEYSEPAAPGSATMITVRLTDNVAYGQLDGQEAAAVVLVSDPGGSGTFYDLAIVVNRDGQPVNIATAFLGDRIDINSLTVADNQIVIDMVQAGPDDPLCCPSQQVVKTFELQGEQLTEISSDVVEGTEAETETPDLVGTVWQWQQTLMNNDDTFIPDNPASYTLQLSPEGQISVQADCNQVNGTYTLADSALTIELGPSTRAACPPGSLGDQFVANLSAAAIYFFQDGNLFIDLMADGGTMQFTAQSSELAGTAWNVSGYNNGQQAVVSVIIDTELTATFGEDGQVTGSAGCNDYSVSYEVAGDSISFGPSLGTLKECAEPEGIMDQEQQYLTALTTAVTYQIRGDVLELRTADGAIAATFQAAN